MKGMVSFKNRVFISVVIVFFILIALFFSYLYWYVSEVFVNNELNNFRPIIQKMSDNMDSLYKQINTAENGFTTYNEVMNIIVNLNTIDTPQYNSFQILDSKNKLSPYLTTIYTSVAQASKIMIFKPNKFVFRYLGGTEGEEKIPQKYLDRTWLAKTFKKNELYGFVQPHYDDWSETPKEVISFYKKFSNPFFDDFGILEIQLPSKVFKDIFLIDGDNSGRTVVVFDEDGELAFPFYADTNDVENIKTRGLISEIRKIGTESGVLNFNNDTFLFSLYKSDYTGLTTMIVDSKRTLLEKLTTYRNMIVIIGFSILAISIVFYYFFISKLTKPLKHLIGTLKNVNLDNLYIEVPHNGYDEFKLLNSSFEKMFERLKDSINKEYEFAIREMKVHLEALQAQINPHFIYNVLSVISACCDKNDPKTASDMTNKLSLILRYMASTKTINIPLSDEINHIRNYLELIKLHYKKDSLSYFINIPEDMNHILIPKLSIQPIIENSINHGFRNTLPPWEVRISATHWSPAGWEIVIEDNGTGFRPEVLEKIKEDISQYRLNILKGNLLNNLQIGGLGILNTFARLTIHFGKAFSFSISNKEPHGSRIKLCIKDNSKEEPSI